VSTAAPGPVRPKMLVIAGPPASGRTGVSIAAREPLDSIDVGEAGGPADGPNGEPLRRAAAALAASQQFVRRHLAERRSFLVRTALDTGVTLDQATLARAAGFATQMIYIATNDPAVNVRRSLARACCGGRGLDSGRVAGAYHRSLANLPRAVREFDAVLAYDNSKDGRDPLLQFQFSRGGLVRIHESLEPWAERVLAAVRLLADAGANGGPGSQ
jgi:predicted ABC-type ATPase